MGILQYVPMFPPLRCSWKVHPIQNAFLGAEVPPLLPPSLSLWALWRQPGGDWVPSLPAGSEAGNAALGHSRLAAFRWSRLLFSVPQWTPSSRLPHAASAAVIRGEMLMPFCFTDHCFPVLSYLGALFLRWGCTPQRLEREFISVSGVRVWRTGSSVCLFLAGVGNPGGPQVLAQGCAPRMARLRGRSLLAAGCGLQMVGKEAHTCPPLHKAILTVEPFLLRYGPYSTEEDEQPGKGAASVMSTRRNCEGRLCEQLCGDLWESGAAGEGCGCYQLGGLNAHLHCYWHINYRCQGDSEGKDFWGSDVTHAPGYGLISAQICPLGTQEASTGTEVKVPSPSSHDAGAAALIAKAAMARKVPEWVLRSQGDLWEGRVGFLGWQEPCLAACMHHFGLGAFIPLWIWKHCWRREGILFLGNGIGFWVQPAAEEKTGYPRTGRSKEGKR